MSNKNGMDITNFVGYCVVFCFYSMVTEKLHSSANAFSGNFSVLVKMKQLHMLTTMKKKLSD